MEPGPAQNASTIFVCDLDGTLLRSDATLSAFARDGLGRLIEAGAHLTIASARGTAGMRALLEGVPLRLPVIELNGAFVSELDSGRHLAGNVLSEQDACAALEAILATGVDPVVSSWDGQRDRVHFGARVNESIGWYVEEKKAHGDPRLNACADLLAMARREQVAQITTFALGDEAGMLIKLLARALGDDADRPRLPQLLPPRLDRNHGSALRGGQGGGDPRPACGLRCARGGGGCLRRSPQRPRAVRGGSAKRGAGKRPSGRAGSRHRGGCLQRRGWDRALPARAPPAVRGRRRLGGMNPRGSC